MTWWALGFLLSATVIASLSPLLVSTGRWRLLRPQTALTAWFVSLGLGLTCILGTLTISAAGAVTHPSSITGPESLSLTIAAWIGLGALGALIAYISVSAEPLIDRQRDGEDAFSRIAHSRDTHPGFTLVRFNTVSHFAFAVPGRRPEIFLSSATESTLSEVQLRAVLAHEYAHLRKRHHVAVRIAQISVACLPSFRPALALKRAVLLLVELAADDIAAREAGAAHLANALSTLATHTGDPSMHVRAERLTHKRWPLPSRRKLPKSLQEAPLTAYMQRA